MATLDSTVAGPAQKEEKVLLPLKIDLLDAVVSPLASVFLCEVELDYKSLETKKKSRGATSFTSELPGQIGPGKPWSLQVPVLPSEIQLRVWRTARAQIPAPLAIAMRLFSSTTSQGWSLLSEVRKGTDDLVKVQDSFEIAEMTVSKEKLEEEQNGLWSRRYRIEISIFPDVEIYKGSKSTFAYRQQVPNFQASSTVLSRVPHDVKLFFPSASTAGAALWSAADSLSAFSPYFKTLLSSDFSEAVTRYTSEHNEPGPEVVKDGDTEDFVMEEVEKDSGEDSDDELDELFFSSPPSSLSSDSSATRPYRRVTVRGAWSTYRAVLAYGLSGHLTFAPLRSSRLSEADSSSHLDALRKQLADSPNLPLPVSLKSVYRAAHLLELPTLSSLALREFRRRLTPSIAVVELFTPTAAKYDELREVALNYVVKSWAECKDLEEMKEAKEKVKRGEWPHGGAVMVELLDKLEEKRAALA